MAMATAMVLIVIMIMVGSAYPESRPGSHGSLTEAAGS
jgi:hypothetical protein